jgi:hypothetical protein
MVALMIVFGVLFVVGLIYWFMTALRDERKRPVGGAPNRPG